MVIRQYIKQLLKEAIDPRIQSRVDMILSSPNLMIGITRSPTDIFIYYARKDEDGKLIETSQGNAYGLPYGNIEIFHNKNADDGICLGNTWQVIYTDETTKGWGPLLYELAIELASQYGEGLMPDRSTVSDSAKRVWEEYDKRGDVIKKQLDIDSQFQYKANPSPYRGFQPRRKNRSPQPGREWWHGKDIEKELQLTKDNPRDDCKQTSAWNDYYPDGENGWSDSALSRLYSKASPDVWVALEKKIKFIK